MKPSKSLGSAVLAIVVVSALALGVATKVSAATQPIKMPVDRSLVTLASITQKHHDYPAVDIPVPTGSGVHALVGGTIQRTFYEAGGCGYGVTLVRGNSVYTYCHGNGVFFVKAGDAVGSGQRLMRSGNTGSSTGPHLHIQVKINGQLRCPQALLRAAWNNQSYDPQNLPATGCTK